MNKFWIFLYVVIAAVGIVSGVIFPFTEEEIDGIPDIPVQGETQSNFMHGFDMVLTIFWHNFQIDLVILLFSFGGLHLFYWFVNTRIIGWLIYLWATGVIYPIKALWVLPTLLLELSMWVIVLHYSHKIFIGNWTSESFSAWRTKLIKNYGIAFATLIIVGIPLVLIGAIVEAVSLLII